MIEVKAISAQDAGVSDEPVSRNTTDHQSLIDQGTVQIDGPKVTHLKTQTVQPSQDFQSGFQEDSILSTAKAPTGRPLNDMTQINDDTIVNI